MREDKEELKRESTERGEPKERNPKRESPERGEPKEKDLKREELVKKDLGGEKPEREKQENEELEKTGISGKEQKAIANRIAKTIGHTKSIRYMVESGRDCSEVLIQLAAVKAAINSTGKELLKIYIKKSLQEAVESQDQEKLKELNRAIELFMK